MIVVSLFFFFYRDSSSWWKTSTAWLGKLWWAAPAQTGGRTPGSGQRPTPAGEWRGEQTLVGGGDVGVADSWWWVEILDTELPFISWEHRLYWDCIATPLLAQYWFLLVQAAEEMCIWRSQNVLCNSSHSRVSHSLTEVRYSQTLTFPSFWKINNPSSIFRKIK